MPQRRMIRSVDDAHTSLFVSGEAQQSLYSDLLHDEGRVSSDEDLSLGYRGQGFQDNLQSVGMHTILRFFDHVHAL